MSEHRRIRNRLSIGEIDATWISTYDSHMYRFHDGQWESSRNVYYGKDAGWWPRFDEPVLLSSTGVFIEMLPTQQADDPEFGEIISRYHQEAPPR